MRILCFDRQGEAAVGIRLGNEVVDLAAVAPELPRTVAGLIAAGSDALAVAKNAAEGSKGPQRLPLATIKHRIPLPNPDKNIGLGLNYLSHIRKMDPNFPEPDFPGMFMRVASSLVAHEAPIIRPKISDTLDYEGELAFVIGKGGKHIPKDRALEHVAGYMCHNDASVREFNFRPLSVTAGKNFPQTGAFGEIVTVDELPAGCRDLRLQTHVNGELRQNENLSNMKWGVADLIYLMSRMMELAPGDILTTGTPAGCAAEFKPPRYLKAGDVVEVSIEGIGTLRNPIIDEA